MKMSKKPYEPKEVEERIYKLWERSGFFNPDKLPGKRRRPYSIVLPPPNVTGSLHMGHALNATVQDILIRWRRLQGYKTLWLPGTDHAGIATQNVVEKQLKKQGITRFDLGREEFIKRVWQWKEKYGNLILEQFKKLGCSLDWSRTRFTLDKGYVEAVERAFFHYYKKGWIYRGKRAINWCPRCQTSLSDLEIEYKEKEGSLWYIRYPLTEQGRYIVVATTRPETMLGDRAVAVNPKDKRYKELVGKKAILPLINQEIPIIADSMVDPDFGTGAVKVTPAHDMKDYEMGIRHRLEIFQVIDERGKMINVPSAYQGLTVLEAREKVVSDLKKQGFLERSESYIHQIPKCYRCGTTIEIIPSFQWFLRMKELAKMAEEAVKKGKVRFHPKAFEKPYFNWLKNIKDWCISRQIWWGHRLPIWRCQKEKKYFISLKKPKRCPVCGRCKPKQSEDVLDTWFSSALWPFAALGWPQKSKKARRDQKRFYPTDVLSTARDIINLWVARMIFSGREFTGKVPFYDVYIHPTVLTREGKRMSKSLGTGIDPLLLVEKYGADATRFGIAYQVMGGQDIRFVEDNIIMGKKFCNKIWNAARFVLLQLPKTKRQIQLPKSSNLTPADKRILNHLKKTAKSVDRDLNSFRFGQAAHKLYDFFWHDFCDIYIEQSKKQLSKEASSKKRRSLNQNVLVYVLFSCLKLLHPFVPFITEKIYQMLPLKNKKRSLMVENWPE